MGEVVHATFGGTSGYDEALFRQALREEILENGGSLTHSTIKSAFLRTVDIATVFKVEDPDALDQYVDITLTLLKREQVLAGEHWSP